MIQSELDMTMNALLRFSRISGEYRLNQIAMPVFAFISKPACPSFLCALKKEASKLYLFQLFCQESDSRTLSDV